jgi:hypothetical protein
MAPFSATHSADAQVKGYGSVAFTRRPHIPIPQRLDQRYSELSVNAQREKQARPIQYASDVTVETNQRLFDRNCN